MIRRAFCINYIISDGDGKNGYDMIGRQLRMSLGRNNSYPCLKQEQFQSSSTVFSGRRFTDSNIEITRLEYIKSCSQVKRIQRATAKTVFATSCCAAMVITLL